MGDDKGWLKGDFLRRSVFRLTFLLTALLLLAACDETDVPAVPAPVVTTTVAQQNYTVSYATGDCPFFFDADVEPDVLAAITCGYMQVPQDRNEPDGLQIEIAVAIVQSLSDDPLPDPIVYFEGGPGGGALYSAEWWLDSPLREDREIILFDQRGTGYSWPNLGCPELNEDDVLDATDNDPFFDALTACRDRLIDLGADLADYHTAASAQDVADLRQVLGVEEWNLYGISYGTRLALTVMRDQPAGVRSVVLDSVYPPNVDAYADQSLTFGGAIDLMLDGCADDADCDDAFPDLRQTFYELILSLDQEPLFLSADEFNMAEDMEVDAYTFVSQVTNGLYDTELIPLLPQLIVDTYNGNYDLLLEDFLLVYEDEAYRQRPDDDEPVDESSLSDAQGMFYSVECYEEAPFANLDDAQAKAETLDPVVAEIMLQDVYKFFDACAIWLDEQSPIVETEAVYSELPVLIFAGEYDPVTPPSWGLLAAETLPNHFYVELPRGGHAVSDVDDCMIDIFLAFLADPTQPPDTECVAESVRPFGIRD